jgi:Protein of unknown function (DUF2510)
MPQVANEPKPSPHQVAAGWLPDPESEGQLRYWDGSIWTNQVLPSPDNGPAAALKPARGKVGSSGRRLAWGTLATLLIGVSAVVYAMSRGQDIKRVTPSGEIEFYSTGEQLSQGEIENRQGGLEQRVSELEQEAKSRANSGAAPQEGADLRGSWIGENGLRYSFQQFGSEVVIQEISPYGVTAAGQGVVQGSSLNFNYQAIDGSFGSGTFNLEDSRTLRGVFNNQTYYLSTPAVLRRE